MQKSDSYSQAVPVIKEKKNRERIGQQFESILKVHLQNLNETTLLDVGCSTGIVTNHLSSLVKKTIGIDIDKKAIKEAERNYQKKNLKFIYMNAEKTTFKDNYFDVILLNQIYEFVDNQKKLVKEVYRILKPGGVCLVGARNKLSFFEGQTNIPLIHFLPEKSAMKIASILGKSYYPAKYLTLKGLYKLFKPFEVENIMPRIIKNPDKYEFAILKKYSSIIKFIPERFIAPMMFLVPNYFLLCKKI